ncbi:MAG: hypothetical protein ACTSU2_17040 [Promethearchaeota archaeon]
MSERNGKKKRIESIRRLKHEAIALIVFSSVLLGVYIGIGGQSTILRPKVTTMFFHYNLQYRAGNLEVENTILNESLRSMINMFDKHPTWKYTIEIQSYAIEKLLKNESAFPNILQTLQRQVNRGQLELICGLYSSQILNAYPGDPLDLSVKITYNILKEANLTRSRVMLFQEGQFAPGLAYHMNRSYWKGIDTVIISQQQLIDFWPKWQALPPSNVPLFISRLGDRQINILRYDYAPRVEAGYYHGWIYWSDAELAIEKDHRASGEPEFTVDPNKVKNFEAHYANLEKLGVKFMTIEEWVQHCIDAGYYQELGHYQMSTHWGPTKYDTCYVWFGDNSGNVDDGDMLSDNYRGRNILEATMILNETYWNSLDPANRTLVNQLLNSASRSLILAMVTDTTGINPNPTEREYGYTNIRNVFLNCSEVVKIYTENIPQLAGATQIQIDLATKNITTTPKALFSINNNLTFDELNQMVPINISTQTTGKAPDISVQNITYDSQDLIKLEITFPGTRNWSIRNDDVEVKFSGNLEQVVYSPPLAEDLSVRVNRSDYTDENILNIHIPLSNGLIFIPNSRDSNKGLAIIHNTSQYQIAPRWKSDSLTYMTGKIVFPAPFQFFILNNTDIANAKYLANHLNNNVTWTIAPNVTQMQGFEYLQAYFNSYRGDQWSQNEWW